MVVVVVKTERGSGRGTSCLSVVFFEVVADVLVVVEELVVSA